MADKFKKGKSNFATTLVTGIGTGTGDTITLNSTTGLPTDTEITLTFNRVTSGGVVNSTSVMERITGTISGATLTSYTRGVDGTTEQAHAGGTVVEYIPNAADMNDQVDGILVGHNQDGTHKSGIVLTLPQINDTSSDHQYVVAVSELTADRTVTLPLLTGNDEFVFKDHAQTLTNKTLTSPVINGAVTGTMTPPKTFFGANFIAPEGFLLNGKIVPSVANNDLTVALKGLDGNDPSATNPVYCRIGDTVHAITAALSVTKADGTNWFNAGSAELATKEIDYFVYLGYNATDGVVIGFSRIPYATQYDQFSATTTNAKYCAISTISNAAAGDDYTVVGRFAATLSAGAGYTWTVPTFTTINLIQRPIFESRILTWLPTLTGFSTTATGVFVYQVKQDKCKSVFNPNGLASNATALDMTLPIYASGSAGVQYFMGNSYDNNAQVASGSPARISASGTLIECWKTTLETDNYTASNAKAWSGSIEYFI
jgi:hypothetical protein